MIAPKFKVGDGVAFANRAQPGPPPFIIEEVDETLFGVRYRLEFERVWWTEGCFMPYEEWRKS